MNFGTFGLGFRSRGGNGIMTNLPLLADLGGKVAGGLTFSRASSQYVTDFEGQLREVKAGCPAFGGARVVTNLCTNSEFPNGLTDAPTNSGVSTVSSGIKFPAGFSLKYAYKSNYTALAGNTYIFSAVVTMDDGTAPVCGTSSTNPALDVVGILGGSTAASTYLGTTSLGGGKYRCSWRATVPAVATSPQYFGVIQYAANSGKGLTVTAYQVENVTGQSIQTAGEYIPTTSAPLSQCFVTKLDGSPISGLLGILLEPASTNKCTCYGVIPGDSYGTTRTSGYALVKGVKYEIVTRAVLDFTTVGAANNTVGTQFVATGGTLGAGDSVKDVLFGVGTKSYYTGGAWVQNHTNMTLSGDTAAVLTTVDDTAALTAAGLLALSQSGKWYDFDNTAGVSSVAVTFAGVTGNTNPHSFQIRAVKVSGAGNPVLGMSGGESTATITGGAVNTYKCENVTPTATTRGVTLTLPAGCRVKFFIPQLEELPACTSPMPTQGATATRAATLLSFGTTGNIDLAKGTAYLEFAPMGLPNAFRILQTDGLGRLMYVPSGGTGLTIYDGVTTGLVGTLAVGQKFKIAVRYGNLKMRGTCNGAQTTERDFDGSMGAGPTVNVGADSFGGFGAIGYIKNLRIYSKALDDAKCISMTA